MPRVGTQEVHELTHSSESAALSQEGDVDDLTGADLLRAAWNDDQTVGFRERRQQMR